MGQYVARWRRELTSATPNVDLKQHAVRTARALGGLDSIAEVALLSEDQSFTKLLEALYATCRRIRIGDLLQNPDYTH